MMDFNARLEEIRRRSEILKQKQRKRRTWILTSLPLTACLVLCIWLLPGLDIAATDGFNGAASGMPERGQSPEAMRQEQSACTTLSVKCIEITGKGLDRTVSDPAVLTQICALWDKTTAPTPNFSISGAPLGGSGQDPAGVDGEFNTEIYSGKSSPKDYYIVSFTDSNGTVRQYKLNEGVLTELSTGETDFLTEDDLTELYGLLGLPLE